MLALSTGDQFQYDANGNMTRRVEGGVTYTQTFDLENRLSTVTTITGTTTFVYDGDGQRVLQTRPDTSTVAYVGALMEVETNYFYYLPRPSGSSVGSGAIAANGSRSSVTAFVGGAARLPFTQGTVAQLGGGGGGSSRLPSTTIRLYYFANGRPIALRQIANDGANTVYYLHQDQLSSTSLTTDANGAVVGQLRYTAYGALLSSSGTTPTSRRYTGQVADDTTGLLYFHARYYDPMLARWTQPDSIVPEPGNPQALNRYSYVGNGPLRYTDPSGHCFGPLADFCAGLALGLIVNLVVTDIAEDGRFDTPDRIRYAVTTSYDAVKGNPFGPYRDATLPQQLKSQEPGSAPDLTSWLEQTMKADATGNVAATLRNANSGSPSDQFAALMGWSAMVKSGAPWDFKVELNRARIKTVTLGGRQFNFDVVANIHYGYVGIASGFSLQTLLAGAGVAQIMDGTSQLGDWQSSFDDPYDAAAIQLGAWLYKNPDKTFQDAIDLFGDQLSPPKK